MTKNLLIISIIIFLPTTSKLYPSTAEHTSVYLPFQREWLKNFPTHTATTHDEYKEQFKKPELNWTLPKLTPYDEYNILFTTFAEHEHESEEKPTETILNPQSLKDLHLFFYDTQHPQMNMLRLLFRGQTKFGEAALGNLLLTPTTDTTQLYRRQALITWLIDHPEITKKLENSIAEIKKNETGLISLFNQKDILYKNVIKANFFGGDFKQWTQPWCGIPPHMYLQGKRWLNDTLPIIMYFVNKWLLQQYLKTVSQEKRTKRTSSAQSKVNAFSQGFSSFLSLLAAYQRYKEIKNSIDFTKHLNIRFKSLVGFTHLVKHLHTTTQKHPELLTLLPTLRSLSVLDDDTHPFNQFIKTIQTHVAGRNVTWLNYWFTNMGKLLQTLPAFISQQKQCLLLMHTVGLLDAYIGLAKLYKEHRSQPASYSFVKYEEKNRPFIHLVDFWHPMLSPITVIPNSITFGTPGYPQNIVLTGPNAAGKSTVLKAITLCILLGQTVGIAPAAHVAFTPFSKITTYLNIIDKLGEGQSLFKAEVTRAQELMDTIKILPQNKFAFTVMDEIFSGTAPQEGEAAAFGVAHLMSSFENSITLLATHFPKLTTLPRHTNGAFKNYKVFVEKRPDGSIVFPYLLDKGRSHQVIALDLLKKEGFDADILANAYDFLAASKAVS